MLLTYFRVWVFPAGIPEVVEIMSSIEGSLEDVLMSVVVPDSTSSNMVVIEIEQSCPFWESFVEQTMFQIQALSLLVCII
jgi:hypothetical protein